ncbi:sugar ABC transporter ATP-binding protein [Acrocarpospora phusangensis]|uniref:Sugar ABC transporter ATP-binding protein n=1 Tax=Acrocarpospora phusangensis TaxID=1070424 RepID=A0A919QFE8_9ACTN|nr:sugar ABC transporter ATP-binding protein [Acrocarpospora phusangensis]GIH25257.1 sugar ABC transporter ATP-binding protein [Acrocarpospora phusangensis]
MTEPVLRVRGLTKKYPGVTALDRVDFELRRGEVHALFGENGAGKSTLISIISGAQHPDGGTIEVGGRAVELSGVAAARGLGISAVFQEFSLMPTMTVAENLVMGSEPGRFGFVDRRRIRRLARERLEEFGFRIAPDRLVETLSRAEQQMVEIAKAFRPELSVLILDEPTASLTDEEAERLFALVEEARGRGIGIIYITHRMAEIRRLADRVTVLRDGRLVTTVPGDTPDEQLINLMTGRVVEDLYPELPVPGTGVMLAARGLTTFDGSVRNASFELRAGEIVGFAGLMGSGKSAAARACFGLERVDAGTVTVAGQDLTGAKPAAVMKSGVVYLPSDRKQEGLFLERPLRETVTLPWLRRAPMSAGPLLRPGRERAVAGDMLRRMRLSPADPERPAASYSGGNQQKGLLGRALLGECTTYLLDEPTVGVDVGARVTIYEQIVALARAGSAVLVVSSELPEILHLCHRVYVFSHGQITAELIGADINEETILRHMMHWGEPAVKDIA